MNDMMNLKQTMQDVLEQNILSYWKMVERTGV